MVPFMGNVWELGAASRHGLGTVWVRRVRQYSWEKRMNGEAEVVVSETATRVLKNLQSNISRKSKKHKRKRVNTGKGKTEMENKMIRNTRGRGGAGIHQKRIFVAEMAILAKKFAEKVRES